MLLSGPTYVWTLNFNSLYFPSERLYHYFTNHYFLVLCFIQGTLLVVGKLKKIINMLL